MTDPMSAIYTIGHSNVSGEAFVAALQRHGIAAVVDVRSVPFSRYTPQFNRGVLKRALAGGAIAYHFAGDYLGGRPTDPTCYLSGELPEGKADYLSLVDYDEVPTRPWFRRGLDRLLEIVRERPTAIMCSEEDPLRCHRHHLIAQALLTRGVTVRHLRKEGVVEAAEAEPKQMTLLP